MMRKRALRCALLAIAVVCIVWLRLPEKSGGLDARIVRGLMDGEAVAEYTFMGGTCAVYEYGEEYLGVIFQPLEMDARTGKVRFGEKILSAEEYHRLYPDEEDMAYSEEEKAYVGEMGDLWRTRSAPTHEYPLQRIALEDGAAVVWTMDKAACEVFLEHENVSILYDDRGGHWGAMLEPVK